MPKLLIAFAAALLITFATIGEAALLTFSRIPRASLTFLPLTKSITKRALRGVTRTSYATALASVLAGFLGSSTTFLAAFLAFGAFAGFSSTTAFSSTGAAVSALNRRRQAG